MIDEQFLADSTRQLAGGLTVYVYNEKHLQPIINKVKKKYNLEIMIEKKDDYYELKSTKKIFKINF